MKRGGTMKRDNEEGRGDNEEEGGARKRDEEQ